MSYKKLSIAPSAKLPDVYVLKPSMHWDLRGSIYTTYNGDFYPEALPLPLSFKHDKFAQSKQHVLRGLHGDSKTWKLVSCVWGEIHEVVVDMRPESPTYKQWEAFRLSSQDYQQVLIPPGFVNGYYVLSEQAVFHYKLAYAGEYIDAGEQMTVAWNDPELAIEWPGREPILQERDRVIEGK